MISKQQVPRVVLVVLYLCAGSASSALAAIRDEPIAALAAFQGQTVTAITLADNNITKEWVIAREIWSEVGQQMDIETVRGDLVRLENLAIFGSVIVSAIPHEGGVALNYVFTEMPWIIPYPVVSYSEENGFSAGIGVASPNFLGRHITLAAGGRFGGTTSYSFRAENPWISGNHRSAGVQAFHQTRANKLLDFGQTSDLMAVNVGSYFGERGRLKFDGGFYGVGSDQPGRTLNGSNYDNHWRLGFSVGYDSRDSWRTPHQGWNNEVAVHYFGGDSDTWSTVVDLRRYLPLATRHVLATGHLVSLQSGAVGVEIPAYQQYFLGGANSIRGYKPTALGRELYGKNQMNYTVEYRYLLAPVRPLHILKWSIGVGLETAVFGDVGTAWSRASEFSLARTRAGFGAGLRVLLPGVESVRLDLGVSQYGDVVFNFGVNSIFNGRREGVH